MTQQIFDDLVGNPPPSTVDIERIVRRERRALRARRVTWTLAAAATVAITVITVASLGPPPSNMETAVHVSAAPAESPGPAGDRVNAAWQAATARVLPGAMWSDIADRTPVPTAPALRAIEGALYVQGEISLNGVTGRFAFSAREPYLRAKLRECDMQKIPACAMVWDTTCPPGDECTSRPGPNGLPIRIQRSTKTLPNSTAPLAVLTAILVHPGGGAAVFSITNQKGWQDTPNTSTDLAITEEQLMAILREPGLLP